MNGKSKCRILKEIRRKIAEENDINLVIAECTHKGDCRGTCPRCEAEVRYLEEQLEKRSRLKKRVVLAGVSAGLSVALSGCSLMGVDLNRYFDSVRQPAVTEAPYDILMGEVPIEDLEGEVPAEDIEFEETGILVDGETEYALSGDIAPEDECEIVPEEAE